VKKFTGRARAHIVKKLTFENGIDNCPVSCYNLTIKEKEKRKNDYVYYRFLHSLVFAGYLLLLARWTTGWYLSF
jgi:hypothetical protein